MNAREQSKTINTLIQMGVLVRVSYYIHLGMRALIYAGGRYRTVPLSIAVRYAKDAMRPRR